jgi:type II secretory ATPase GspE/PulE/Tfp pilus assembly ATPase PilB-like protein
MLRQAPNIILVGEIRDRETAEIAVQAALTGHLVFASLHTNDAPSAVTRLIDIGVKPFLVSAAVQAIMAQRLVRVLCKECKEAYTPTDMEISSLGMRGVVAADVTLYRPVGCPACEHTGYYGRFGLFELLSMDTTLREMTFRQESTVALRHYARSSGGMTTLVEDGARKVIEGVTSVDEVLRVTSTME